MKVTFRNGIARRQRDVAGTDVSLSKNVGSNSIDLHVNPDPTVIIFAHRNTIYTYEENRSVPQAWVGFPTSGQFWLYWDINLMTGALTRGFTARAPIFSSGAPGTPLADQHWFDTANHIMKVWSGSQWQEKVRVFAAIYTTPLAIQYYPLGSNYPLPPGGVGELDSGHILLDIYNKPIRQYNPDGSGSFVFATSASKLALVGYSTHKIQYETAVLELMADENIPAFSAVRVIAGRRCRLARNTDYSSRVIGVVTSNLYVGEVGNIVPAGLIRSDGFAFAPDLVGLPVFCGVTGQLTVVPNVYGIIQQVGYIYDTDAVFIGVKAPIILDDIGGTIPPPAPPPPQAPVANFQASPLITTGPVPFTVSFTNTSLNSPTTLEWDFTNDGVVDATTQTATYTYVTPGSYTVRLKASNAYGENTEIKPHYITVTGPSITISQTNLEAELSGPAQVIRNQLFTITLVAKNDGLLTATGVERIIEIDDVGPNKITVSGLPPGATQARAGKKLVITFGLVPSIPAGAQISTSFTVLAPPNGTKMDIRASVSSPQQDVETRDNVDAITIQVRNA